jgi:hypothetical protein
MRENFSIEISSAGKLDYYSPQGKTLNRFLKLLLNLTHFLLKFPPFQGKLLRKLLI